MQIKTLFDAQKDIYRKIEKVITYNVSKESLLKSEITEYIVTDSIEDQFENLLSKMQAAMEAGGENEVGVWVSGFYGSGKSSFTKYLGLALDESAKISDQRFLKYLQDRMTKAQTKALLSTVATRFPAAVILLDLASEMLAGATMEDVSTVLYYKVLQWAGYSKNIKVAAFERKLKKDGRYVEFTQLIQSTYGVEWKEIQSSPLEIDTIIPEIAHQMYPALFKTPNSFNTESSEYVRFENERVQEMIDIVHEATGKQNFIFIIDEVGQYVASRPNLILNLDGLAKNLKALGKGKVWIIGTAQQTLTEDDPRAALNSPELYKLKDRFPIQIDLESSDIKEICYRRLLGKSNDGEQKLGALFENHGPELRFNTRLENAKYYDADFDKTTFTNLYPFLPAHFDILLHLLGALAKSTGGIGLRSAIKVIQDILIEGPDGQQPVADQPMGWLATTVTLYDSLEKDIKRAAPSIHKAVGKALIRFPDSPIHQEVAKSVAVLQILGNMPVTAQNITSLTHPAVNATLRREQIDAAIHELINDGFVPFGEKEGNLCFFSEKINDIDQERTQIPLRSIETRRVQNEALREAFDPLPATRLNGSLAVSTGLKASSGALISALAGERETIQTVVEFVPPADYETMRLRLLDESRQNSSKQTIFLLGRSPNEVNDIVAEIYRSREIANRHRSDPDQEVKDYCVGQTDRANRKAGDLKGVLKRSLAQGSFIFRGQLTAVESLDNDLLESAKKFLATVAAQVFERHNEAPLRADTTLAEKFLRVSNLRAVSSDNDPMGLVQLVAGSPRIKSDHKALISIRDYIDRVGAVDGKGLSDHFSDAPFGWSPDTLRYLVAVMLAEGAIILKISGHDVTVNGQQAIDALRTNNSFKNIGVSLRTNRPPIEVMARVVQRLTELTGEMVNPLEEDVSKATLKYFPQFQQRYGPLEEKLRAMRLPGTDTLHSINLDLANVLLTDASDIPSRLGSEESKLYTNLKWAAQADQAMRNGLEATIKDLQEHWRDIHALPDTGIPGQLRSEAEDAIQQVAERMGADNFFAYATDLNSALTAIKSLTSASVERMILAQQDRIRAAQQELQRLLEWGELTMEEQAQILAGLEGLAIAPRHNLAGLKALINQDYKIQSEFGIQKNSIIDLGRQRQLERLKEEKEKLIRDGGGKLTRKLRLPGRVTSTASLDEVLQQIQSLKNELSVYADIEVTIEIEP